MLRCQCLSVCLSVTEVHWRIIANLGFKFRSQFTAYCGRGACGREGRDHRRKEWMDHLALCSPPQTAAPLRCNATDFLIGYNGPLNIRFQNYPLPQVAQCPRSHCTSLDQPDPPFQSAVFSQVMDRQTEIERQTTHGKSSVPIANLRYMGLSDAA